MGGSYEEPGMCLERTKTATTMVGVIAGDPGPRDDKVQMTGAAPGVHPKKESNFCKAFSVKFQPTGV